MIIYGITLMQLQWEREDAALGISGAFRYHRGRRRADPLFSVEAASSCAWRASTSTRIPTSKTSPGGRQT